MNVIYTNNIVTSTGLNTALVTNVSKIGSHEIYNLETETNFLLNFVSMYSLLRRASAPRATGDREAQFMVT